MRLWTVHPAALDARGLVALWREALLAQAVLREQTRGYRHHPQLERFRALRSPLGGIAEYLRVVQSEAERRGYAFDASKIGRARYGEMIPVTRGQLAFEWTHLTAKLRRRDPARCREIAAARPRVHPLFGLVPGGVEGWERG